MSENEKLLTEAVARGWCSPENSGKVMDPELAFAIVREVQATLAQQAAPQAPSGWRTIESAPRDVQAIFWTIPLTVEDNFFVDTSGNPILSSQKPTMYVGKHGTWCSLVKATHWMPLPPPPAEREPQP